MISIPHSTLFRHTKPLREINDSGLIIMSVLFSLLHANNDNLQVDINLAKIISVQYENDGASRGVDLLERQGRLCVSYQGKESIFSFRSSLEQDSLLEVFVSFEAY